MKHKILTDESIHARTRTSINIKHTFSPNSNDPRFCDACSCPEGDANHQVSPNEPGPDDDTDDR